MNDRAPRGAPPSPPEKAEALLRRCLPEGELGLTILGDLRQELEEGWADGSVRHPDFWYWRTALGLSARYSFQRWKGKTGNASTPKGPGGNGALFTDVKLGLRMLVRTPLVSLIAIITTSLIAIIARGEREGRE